MAVHFTLLGSEFVGCNSSTKWTFPTPRVIVSVTNTVIVYSEKNCQKKL